ILAALGSAWNTTQRFLGDEEVNALYIPAIVILTGLTLSYIVGLVFTTLLTEPRNYLLTLSISTLPLLNTFYSSIRDFTEAFVGDAKKFNEPVLVEVNETGLKKIGFLTQRDLHKIGLSDEVIVYFPYSYSFAGQVVVVKLSRVTKLHMSATDAM